MSVKTLGRAAGGGGDFWIREIWIDHTNSTTPDASVIARVYYAPIQIPHAVTVDAILIMRQGPGAPANVYVALYDSTAAFLPRNRLAVSNSNPASGGFQKEVQPLVAAVAVQPGFYFAAYESNGAVDTVIQSVANDLEAAGTGAINYYTEDLGGYAIPPAIATPVQAVLAINTRFLGVRISSIP